MTNPAPEHFVRQLDDYSCGPACLATVAKLYGVSKVDYDFFRGLLNPDPQVGSCNFKMSDVSRLHLPFASSGEDCYAGGVAVACITEDEGHYVVFLCMDGEDVVYYCPYDHKIYAKKLSGINWVTESGHLRRWAINFDDFPGNAPEVWKNISL